MLGEHIALELKRALKERHALRLSVFRMLASAVHAKEIEKRTRAGEGKPVPLSDEEVTQVIRSELKKRKDAVEAYRRGGRPAAAAQEQAEAEILTRLLPQELDDDAVEAVVDEGIASLGATSEKDFGKVMGWVMARLKGQASGERVSDLIRKKISAR